MGKNNEQLNVKFTKEQREIIHSLVGIMGGTDSEVVRVIVLAWFSEKAVISDLIKNRIVGKKR
jgi:hypothetical protein